MKHLQLILQHFWKRCKTHYLIDLREALQFSTKDKGYGKIALSWCMMTIIPERFGDWEWWSSSSRTVMVMSEDKWFTCHPRLVPIHWGNHCSDCSHLKSSTQMLRNRWLLTSSKALLSTTKERTRRAAAEIARMNLTTPANQSYLIIFSFKLVNGGSVIVHVIVVIKILQATQTNCYKLYQIWCTYHFCVNDVQGPMYQNVCQNHLPTYIGTDCIVLAAYTGTVC
jgi:hypothetical protein